MGRHLTACRRKAVSKRSDAGAGDLPGGRSLRITVADRYDPRYWMQLEVPGNLQLRDLDGFLRSIWLECCGHLSAFYISEVMYQVANPDWFNEFGLGPRSEDMGFAARDVLRSGQSFTYEYDFGTTTELVLRVISEHTPMLGKDIQLLAINDPPPSACYKCGDAAADQICTDCLMQNYPHWESAYLCDGCSVSDGCDPEAHLPVVNSPRVGMCGYVG